MTDPTRPHRRRRGGARCGRRSRGDLGLRPGWTRRLRAAGPGIQSGWRLALREFLDNRLAVVGLAVLLFFILFCFLGPIVYHTNQTLTNPLVTDLPPGAAICLAPTRTVSTSSAGS